jgi:DNA-binding response OmpR family regulator
MNEPLIDLTGARILIVDDVPANLDVLSLTLEDSGYNVLVATSGEMALKVAAQAGPELILLDVSMPGIDGFEACRRLKAAPETRDAPVLFLTARNEVEGILEGFQSGGVDYITKPFQVEEVLIRIRTHLERSRLIRQLAELNAHLERKVAERTTQLRLKVRELEGRDRIAQHLLTMHNLKETLDLVLEVIIDIAEVDRAIIYLDSEGAPIPAAALGPAGRAHPEPEAPSRRQALAEARKGRRAVNVPAPDDGSPFAVTPILKGDALLGLIAVEKEGGPIPDDLLRVLERFAVQAAVAINDAQVQQDTSRWQSQIEEALDVKDIVLEDFAPARRLDRDADAR